MTGKRYFLLLLQLVWLTDAAWAQQQRPSYSLQAAVDELHRREAAKYPLNAPPSQQHYLTDQDYWEEDTDFPAYTNKLRNRHRLNKALSKFLQRENYETNRDDGLTLWPFGGYEFDDDNNNPFSNYPDEKKRSTPFRERDSKYENPSASVFRERETQVSNNPEHAELTEQFLREIEEAQEHEREERYKDALRHLWEKYQQKENELEGDLFEEKKRIRTPPYYMLMQKKRSYPVLPWLPYSADRKKRFPVSKRSTKRSLSDVSTLGKTEEKVAKELSELFGTTVQEMKKRSTNEHEQNSSTLMPSSLSPLSSLVTHSPDTTSTVDMRLETSEGHENKTSSIGNGNGNGNGNGKVDAHADADAGAGNGLGNTDHHQHKHDHSDHHDQHKAHKHNRRSGGNSHEHNTEEEDSEEADEHDEEHEDEHDEEHDDDHDEDFDEDDEERKKKRDINGEKHVAHNAKKVAPNPDQILHDEMMKSRRKKSIDWSKYFGLDRKKKSITAIKTNPRFQVKKRSAEEDSFLHNKKNRDLDPEKLENMDKKLQSIEDFIISETIKYTGAHEGIANPEEIRRLKDHVLSRLATAYSLEKMRRALEKLRQSVDNENHLLRNVIEPDPHYDDNDPLENQKSLSVKKEKLPVNDPAHNDKTKEINNNALQNLEVHRDDSNEEDNDMKQKKKRNGYLRYPDQRNDLGGYEEEPIVGRYEALNDAYLGNKNYMIGSNQCPIIESMAERCRGVDLLSGDINQELLPICGIHQICYLCGTLQLACDYQYLAEADSICGNNNDCQAAARSVLMILRGTPGPQLGPRECLKNPCLHSAMREIGL